MKFKLFLGAIVTVLFISSCIQDPDIRISKSISQSKANNVLIKKFHVFNTYILRKNNYNFQVSQVWLEEQWTFKYYFFIIPKVEKLNGPPELIINFNSAYITENLESFYLFMANEPQSLSGTQNKGQWIIGCGLLVPDTIDLILVRCNDPYDLNSDTDWIEKIRIAKD